MSALRRVSVEAMMTLSPRLAAMSCGKAVRPSSTGISMSRTQTSMSCRFRAPSAMRPSLTEDTTWICASLSRARVSSPRMIALSSTTMTR